MDAYTYEIAGSYAQCQCKGKPTTPDPMKNNLHKEDQHKIQTRWKHDGGTPYDLARKEGCSARINIMKILNARCKI